MFNKKDKKDPLKAIKENTFSSNKAFKDLEMDDIEDHFKESASTSFTMLEIGKAAVTLTEGDEKFLKQLAAVLSFAHIQRQFNDKDNSDKE